MHAHLAYTVASMQQMGHRATGMRTSAGRAGAPRPMGTRALYSNACLVALTKVSIFKRVLNIVHRVTKDESVLKINLAGSILLWLVDNLAIIGSSVASILT